MKSNLIATLNKLTNAHRILSQEAPHMLEELEATILEKITPINTDHENATLLFFLPQSVIEDAFANPNSPFASVIEKGAPHFPVFEHVPQVITKSSKQTVKAYIAKGGLYHETLDSESAPELWLKQSRFHAETAWLRDNPRKHPLIAYWENKGATLPNIICDDGIDLIIKTLTNFSDVRKTSKMWDAFHRSTPDWRLVSCFILTKCKTNITDAYNLRQGFSEGMKKEIITFLKPRSAHEAMEREVMLERTPNLRAILSIPNANRPETFQEILDIAYDS